MINSHNREEKIKLNVMGFPISCEDCKTLVYWTNSKFMTNENEQAIQNHILSTCADDMTKNYKLCKMLVYTFPIIWDRICRAIERNTICEAIDCFQF